MKKLIPVLVCALLIVSLCTVFVSAETTSLILKDAKWQSTPQDGYECTVDSSVEGKITVSAPGGWPHIRCDFTKEQSITATVKDASLKYDFTVETGATNITLIFAKDGATGYEFPLSNSALKLTSDQIDAGSGDIKAGHYSGTLKLSDLIESKTNLNPTAFDKSFVEDGKLTFAGLIIYATNGATVKVDALEVVTADAPAESSKETSSETSKETSKTETSKTEATSSATNTSSTAPATSGTTPPTGDSNTGMIIALVLGAIAIIAAGSVITAKVRH